MTDALDLPVWEAFGFDNGQRLFDLLAELVTVLPPDDQLDWQEVYGQEHG